MLPTRFASSPTLLFVATMRASIVGPEAMKYGRCSVDRPLDNGLGK
jgi:hypothetical protein